MKIHGVLIENLKAGELFGYIIGGIIIIYLAVGIILGIVEVIKIYIESRRSGKNATSQAVLGLEYGGEGGSTAISLYIFPIFFMMWLWPLFLCHRDSNDAAYAFD